MEVQVELNGGKGDEKREELFMIRLVEKTKRDFVEKGGLELDTENHHFVLEIEAGMEVQVEFYLGEKRMKLREKFWFKTAS
jgi:hypothetical protein